MLSQKGRYALKALLNLARCAPAGKVVRALAEEECIPRKYLEVIMVDLRQAGLVESTRGKIGGYRLIRPANLITFGEIMRSTDGPLGLVPCVSHRFYVKCADCDNEATCAVRKVLAVVRDKVSEILDRTTLADAVAGDGTTLKLLAQVPAAASSKRLSGAMP